MKKNEDERNLMDDAAANAGPGADGLDETAASSGPETDELGGDAGEEASGFDGGQEEDGYFGEDEPDVDAFLCAPGDADGDMDDAYDMNDPDDMDGADDVDNAGRPADNPGFGDDIDIDKLHIEDGAGYGSETDGIHLEPIDISGIMDKRGASEDGEDIGLDFDEIEVPDDLDEYGGLDEDDGEDSPDDGQEEPESRLFPSAGGEENKKEVCHRPCRRLCYFCSCLYMPYLPLYLLPVAFPSGYVHQRH